MVAGALATVTIFGQAMPSSDVQGLVQQTQSVIAMALYFFGMALAVFASAGLVAAVFEPGRIELLLSKPVSRTRLLLGRVSGQCVGGGGEYRVPHGGFVDHFRRQDRRVGRGISVFQHFYYLYFCRAAGRDCAGGCVVGERRR